MRILILFLFAVVATACPPGPPGKTGPVGPEGSSTVLTFNEPITGVGYDTNMTFSATQTGKQVMFALPTVANGHNVRGLPTVTFNLPTTMYPSAIYGISASQGQISTTWFTQDQGVLSGVPQIAANFLFLQWNVDNSFSLVWANNTGTSQGDFSSSGLLTLFGGTFSYVTD